MKLLCIERDAFSPPKLRVGDIYTHRTTYNCVCGHVYYSVEEIPPVPKVVGSRCHFCKTLAPEEVHTTLFFQRRRFAVWRPDELGVTEQDVKELFTPSELVPK